MAYVGFTDFRQNLASHLDEVAYSCAPLVVTVSEEEYEAMQETMDLSRAGLE